MSADGLWRRHDALRSPDCSDPDFGKLNALTNNGGGSVPISIYMFSIYMFSIGMSTKSNHGR